jgi:hypothetical protein
MDDVALLHKLFTTEQSLRDKLAVTQSAINVVARRYAKSQGHLVTPRIERIKADILSRKEKE